MKHISYINNWEQWKKGFTFYTYVKVRFSETDAFEHVNNTNAVVYFEDARLEYFEHIGLRKDWKQSNSLLMGVLADVQCNYIREIKYGNRLTVYTKLANVGNSSIDLHYLTLNENDQACLTGRSTIVQISRENGESIPWSDDMRGVLEKEKLKGINDS